MSSKRKRICYIAGREAGYSRTHNVLTALQRGGFEVATCLPPAKGVKHYPKLLWQFLRKKRGCDLVLVGFYGQLLLPFVRLLTRKPILFDVYISTFGTMVDDRAAASAGSLKAKLFWLADHLAMRWSDRIILESNDHILGYAKTYRIPREKFFRLFLPADDAVIFRREPQNRNGGFLVHFHGEYAPFHGVDVIIRAAKALENENVQFQIIGKGITYERDRGLAKELKVSNIRFIDWAPYHELADYMCRADVCLGFFGDNPRAARVFTNKVVEALAVGQPLITRRNNPVQEVVQDGESALLVEPGKPEALAQAILRLQHDPALRRRLGENAHKVFQKNCSQEVFSTRLKSIIEEMLAHA
jgi:glycosyltransferase involved in cell wall biosynthesis